MELKITKIVEDTMDVSLPLFWKKKANEKEYLGVFSEAVAIQFYDSGSYRSYSNGGAWVKSSEIKNAYNTWEQVTEEEFLSAHEEFLNLLSLTPKLVTV